ncbi:MAG: hypothetical protein E7044_01110 [Lentisphaerae bacterium]|nr:hypothetical protein [Lentisphaerota bacterium]
MADSFDILVDSYRGKCSLTNLDINDLSWLTSFLEAVHINLRTLRPDTPLKTNSLFLANCLKARVQLGKAEHAKFENITCSAPDPNPFSGYVTNLAKFISDTSIKEMEIKIHFNNDTVRNIWTNNILPKLHSDTLKITFQETDCLKDASFLFIEYNKEKKEEFYDYLRNKSPFFCFVFKGEEESANYISISGNHTFWSLGKNELGIIEQFLEFFYLHKRFIEVVQNCMETPTFKTIDEAKKLIELLHCCVPEFHPDIQKTYLLIDNSVVKTARLGEHIKFEAYLHEGAAWKDGETITSTKPLEKNEKILELSSLPVSVAYIYNKKKINIDKVFVLTPEKTIWGKDVPVWDITDEAELDKALKNEKIDLRYNVLSDGGTDSVKLSYTVIQPEKLIGNNGYPCGTKLKLQIKIDNSRHYNVETHPLVCTLGGSPLKLGEPQITGNEIIYTWEYCFNKPGVFEFVAKVEKASKDNKDVTASQKFTVRPIPDAILCAMKPCLKRYSNKIAKVDHEPIIGQIKSIKKFVCFPDVECIFEYAAFNKAEAEAKGASADDIINHKIDCWDSTCTLTSSDTDRDIYTYFSSTKKITFNKAGEFSFTIASVYNPDVKHTVKFKVVKNRSKVALKILYTGFIISIVSLFQYGLAGIGFLKFITPLVTSWIGTHDAEYLSSRQNKIIFWITLLASWGILLWGFWQEL